MTKHRKNKPAVPEESQAPASLAKPAPLKPAPPKLKSKREMEEIKPPNKIQKFLIFLKEAKRELTRVTWPTRKETVQSTGLLLVFVAISAVYLTLVDTILSKVLRGIWSLILPS
ncbi:MAG: preprotein translocase subunit SecE [Deltaproteobacteria bacterium]|jgi:preprotein translocase subunit SecE|nr:preprotein translocase subunit SecE [Deltaproteobacteria bacterium]